MPKPKEDPRLAFLHENRARNILYELTPEAIDDLRYFADNKVDGQPITFDGLRKWMREKHGIDAGRQGMSNYMKKAGRDPWWKK